MKKLFLLCALGGTLCLTGCFQSDTLVTVKPDGSGTVTETFVLGQAALDQMKQMAAGFENMGAGGQATNKTPAKPFEIMDEKKLRADATKMGAGVTFVSAKKVKTAEGEGYTVTYAFTDINKLKINQNKADSVSPPGGSENGGMSVTSDNKPENFTFSFKKGSMSELIIHSPVQPPTASATDDAKKKAKDTPPGSEEMQAQMMGQMFKDMKINIAVQVVGKIEKTDAKYVDGSKVTLLAMDFNKLLADPAKLKIFAAAPPETLEDSKKLMDSVPGMKVELRDTLNIRFK